MSQINLSGKIICSFCFFLIVLSICSCGGNNSNVPDVSGIKVSLETSRFDIDLYKTDTNKIADGLTQLKQKYRDFLDFYLDTLLELGIHGNYSDTNKALRELLTNRDYIGLHDTIINHYPDTKEIENELVKAFQFMKYYYPDYKVPRIIFLSSQLNKYSAFTVGSDIVGIGLDMFLGDDYVFYNSIEIPAYMHSHLRPSYIPVAALSVIYLEKHPFLMDDNSGNRTLLDMMIQRGKQQYYLHKVLPSTPDSVLFGFTQKQLDWCNKNEEKIYNFFIEHNYLYSNEMRTVFPYVTDGPCSDQISAESPGNTGTWLGYKMVLAYMNQHPKTSMPQLLNQPSSVDSTWYPQMTAQQMYSQHIDDTRFLEEAKYKPR